MMSFNRTISGLTAQYLFYPEPVVIWVEGITDIPFYEQAIKRDSEHRVKAAGGKNECLKLAEALIKEGHPAYVVILDGDYDVLKRRRSRHKCVVLLHRHSMENYLFEEGAIESVCCNCACVDQRENLLKDKFEKLLESLEVELMDLVITDIAHHFSETGNKVFPDNVRGLLKSEKKMTFDRNCIEDRCAGNRHNVYQCSIDEAVALLKNFLEKRRFADILRGHFIFSVLRLLIRNIVMQKKRKLAINNEALITMLSLEIWSTILSSDHKS